jgi:hypothetical protein
LPQPREIAHTSAMSAAKGPPSAGTLLGPQ